MNLIEKILKESNELITCYRLEFYKSGHGPFNLDENEEGMSSYVQAYIEININERFSDRFEMIKHNNIPKNYVFAFLSFDTFDELFGPRDLKFLLGIGFIVNTYETNDYKILGRGEIAFNKKTAKLIKQGNRSTLTDEEFDTLIDENY